MERISINLLPEEFRAEEIKRTKFYKVQFLSISVVLFMIFLSIVTISLRVLQNGHLQAAQLKVTDAQAKINSQALITRQTQLLIIKNRLTAINQYLATPSQQTEMYNLVSSLLPASLVVNAASVGADGTVSISALTNDELAVDQLFTDLLDKEKNEGKINKVSIEALSRGRDGVLRLSFRVAGKK